MMTFSCVDVYQNSIVLIITCSILENITHWKAVAWQPGFGFSNMQAGPKPLWSHRRHGLAWLGSWPEAGPSTALLVGNVLQFKVLLRWGLGMMALRISVNTLAFTSMISKVTCNKYMESPWQARLVQVCQPRSVHCFVQVLHQAVDDPEIEVPLPHWIGEVVSNL